MKRFICYIVAILAMTFFVGCEKIKEDAPTDYADYFVGTWDLNVFTIWDWVGYNKTSTHTDNEVITITKISANKVRIIGGINIINATAVVNGKTLFIEEHWNEKATFTPSRHVMDGIFEFTETYMMDSSPPCLTTKYYTATKR